jgi:hypothetical protein
MAALAVATSDAPGAWHRRTGGSVTSSDGLVADGFVDPPGCCGAPPLVDGEVHAVTLPTASRDATT